MTSKNPHVQKPDLRICRCGHSIFAHEGGAVRRCWYKGCGCEHWDEAKP